jgi:hypothetical protein
MYTARTISCFDQYLCMSVAQLTGQESLRYVEACLSLSHKLYHTGLISKRIFRNTYPSGALFLVSFTHYRESFRVGVQKRKVKNGFLAFKG